MPGLLLVVLGHGQLEPALAAGEERRRDLVEVALHRVEGLGEPRLDRLLQLGAELLELREALLEVGALRCELVEPRLLGVVLLLRERVHLAERLAAALEPVDPLGELVAVVALGGLVGIRVLEAAARFVGLRLDPGDLDVDRGLRARTRADSSCRSSTSAAPSRRSSSPSSPVRVRAGVDARAKRRLEARGCGGGRGERLVEPLGAGEHAGELVRPRTAAARADGGVDARGFGCARALAGCGGFGRGGVGGGDERARLGAERIGISRRTRLRSSRRRDGRDRVRRRTRLRLRSRARGAARSRARRARAASRRAPRCARRRPRRARAAAPRRRSTARSSESSARSSRRAAATSDAKCLFVRAPDPQPRRGRRERRLRSLRALLRRVRLALRELRLLGERARLLGERRAARLELEQHRLRRLAGEPELAALRVVAVAVARHGRNRRRRAARPSRRRAARRRARADRGPRARAASRARPRRRARAARARPSRRRRRARTRADRARRRLRAPSPARR